MRRRFLTPIYTITTTIYDTVFAGDKDLTSLVLRNGSSAGIIYLRLRPVSRAAVSATSYEYSLGPGDSIGLTKTEDGDTINGPWDAISDTAGGVTLEVMPIYVTRSR